ncbi:MAG TPA: hypothetical protein VLQ93_20655 [Myxococcaceae bacterium]|nr:hypothetical protein [Myxococcaceae bacterium]
MSEGDFSREERTLAVAERIADVLRQQEVPTAVIGAVALAVHLYPRSTTDFDLATNIEPFAELRRVEWALGQQGFKVHRETPEPGDPLGGLLRVEGDDFDTIEVVNFYNPWPNARDATVLAREALREADIPLSPDSPLRVVRLPHLIALKLYAGGRKSESDVVELLERNREHLDVAELRDICGRHGLGPALEPLLKELGFE